MSSDPPNPKPNGLKTRFSQNNCANPWGRRGKPKEAPQFDRDEIERRFFADPIELSANGKPIMLPTYEAALLVLRNKAMKGEMPALRLFFQVATKSELARAAGVAAAASTTESDEALIAAFLGRQTEPTGPELGGDDE